MKVLIAVSMVIIFISAFFTFFIFDTVIKTEIECISGIENQVCDEQNFSLSFIFGLFMIGVFVLIDIIVVYIVAKIVTSKEALTYIFK